jgi:hypothetical protein
MSDENFEIEHWFCNGCKTELDPMSVTFNENCVYCGHAAEWIKSISVIRENEKLKREIDEMKGLARTLIEYVPKSNQLFKRAQELLNDE